MGLWKVVIGRPAELLFVSLPVVIMAVERVDARINRIGITSFNP